MSEDPQWPRASEWLASGSSRSGRRLAVVGVPLSRTSISPSGAHETPAAIRAALRRFPTFHAGLDVDLAEIAVADHGDLPVHELSGDDAVDAVFAGLTALPSANLAVLLGGDNAVTRPAMRALFPDLGRAGLLTLDAHHDVRGFHDGATNGTPVRGLVEDGLPGACVVHVGIGDLSNSRAYRSWCDEQGIVTVSVGSARGAVGEVVRRELDRLASFCDALYVDLDVDVVDRAFAPGCPGSRPGGLMPHELLEAAVEAGLHPAVRAVDIVEVDSTADSGGLTVDLAAMCLLAVAAGFAVRGRSGARPDYA